MNSLPILYSFRRCPYAMRARLALCSAGVPIELREVVLKNKPADMLALSPKATVPVMQLTCGEVIDESLDIMRWALQQNDPNNWLDTEPETTAQLIAENDGELKPWLDRYKYFERYPEHNQLYYREQLCHFLQHWEQRLGSNNGMGLVANHHTLADTAILPFLRQLAHTDLNWFESAPYPYLQQWLEQFKHSQAFVKSMRKWPAWRAESNEKITVDWK